jgi:hypothetical protein
MDDRGSIPGRGRIFFFAISSKPALEPTQPPIKWVWGALSPELERPEREADGSRPSSAEINAWSYTSVLPYLAYLAQVELQLFRFLCDSVAQDLHGCLYGSVQSERVFLQALLASFTGYGLVFFFIIIHKVRNVHTWALCHCYDF